MAQTHKWQEYYEAFTVFIGDAQSYKQQQDMNRTIQLHYITL